MCSRPASYVVALPVGSDYSLARPMRRMGFTHHPGPLPFITVRRQQWANRLQLGENIEIHGEHGCPMPPIAAKVVFIGPHAGPPPADLATVYAGQQLCGIALAETDQPWVKVGESWERAIIQEQEVGP